MKKHDPIHADHRVQRNYPAKVKFCPLCGAAMESRMLMPENAERKVCTRCGFVLFPGPEAGRRMLGRRRRARAAPPPRHRARGRQVDLPRRLRRFRRERRRRRASRDARGSRDARRARPPARSVQRFGESPSSSISPQPGKELPSLSDEASEVRYFAPDEIPWPDLAFPTTTDAITAWVASTRKPRQSP